MTRTISIESTKNHSASFAIIFGIWGFLASLIIGYFIGILTAGFLFIFPFTGGIDENILSAVPMIAWVISIIVITVVASILGHRYGKGKGRSQSKKKVRNILIITVLILVLLIAAFALYANQETDKQFGCAEDIDCVYTGAGCASISFYMSGPYSELDYRCGCINNKCKLNN